jgi:hypothetical protein
MRRREMVIVLGCFIVSICIGTVILFQSDVGSPVSMGEAGMVVGGTCLTNGMFAAKICFDGCASGGCGCTKINRLVADPAGGTPMPAVKCGTSRYCTAINDVSGRCGGA